MIHLLGAITLCMLSVRLIKKAKQTYVEEEGMKAIIVIYVLVGVACFYFAIGSSEQFFTYWRAL